MLRPFVLAFLVNIIILTSYAVAQETQTATANATAEASAGPEGSTSSSSATATTKTTTTTTTESDSGSGSNPSTPGQWSNCESGSNSSTPGQGSNCGSGSNSSTLGQGSNNNTETCDYRDTVGEYDEPYDCSNSLTPATESIFKFTLIFYKYFLVDYPNDSMVGAPLSTWYYIASTALYTYGETSREILKFLRLPNKKQVRCIMKYINTFFQNDPEGVNYKYIALVATDINEMNTGKSEQDAMELLEGEIISVNFSDPITAAKQVEMRISEKTDGEITNTIPSEEVNKAFNERSLITWFAGESYEAFWQKPFDENNITMADYYISSYKVIQTPFVFQRGIYRYKKSSYFYATMVEIPFVGEQYTCLLILPDTRCGLLSLVQNLIDYPEKFLEEYKSMDYECLELFLPVYRNVSSVNDGLEIMKEVSELDRLYNPDTAQTQNACGEPTDRAVTAHYQGVKVENILSGRTANDEPSGTNDNECSANTGNDNKIPFEVKYEAIYLILNRGIPILCSTGRVTDKEYNTSV